MANYSRIPKRNQWKIMYLSLLKKIKEIHSVFPVEIVGEKFNNFEEYLEKCEEKRSFQDFFYFDNVCLYSEEIEWLINQKKKFYNGTLSVDRVQKLMILGLFENSIGYNEEDEYIFDVYFKDVDNLVDFDNYTKEENWQLKVAKYMVEKYYYRKENQKYDMSDYIGIILEEIIDLISNNEKLEFKKLERKILTEISKLNGSNNKTDEIDLEEQEYEIDEEIDSIFIKKYLKEILDKYDERTRKIIKCRYGIVDEENEDGKIYTQEECAKKFGISNTRIMQIEHRTIRDIFRKHGRLLKDYVDSTRIGRINYFSYRHNRLNNFYQKLYNGLKKYEKEIYYELNYSEEVIKFFALGHCDKYTLNDIEYLLERTKNKTILENKDKVLRQIQYVRSIQDKIKPRYIK